MLYFSIRQAIRNLSKEQKGELLDAILEYADPDGGGKPDFGQDALLDMAWEFIAPALDRDDGEYAKKTTGRRYAAYCGACERNHIEPLSRDDWEAMDCPTYTQLRQREPAFPDAMPANAHNARNAGICGQRKPDTDSSSIPNTNTVSVSRTESETDTRAALLPDALLQELSPSVRDLFTEWMEYTSELGKKIARRSRERYAQELEDYAGEYGVAAVRALIDEAMRNGWRNLYFEKLEKNPHHYDPERFAPE